MYILNYVSCGNELIPKMNAFFPELVHLIVNLIKIGTPILLVILGMMDMFKAVTSQKEDEIKKAQGLFFKRLIAGVLVFLVFVIVELVFGLLASSTKEDQTNIWGCVDCFIDGPNGENSSCKVVKTN